MFKSSVIPVQCISFVTVMNTGICKTWKSKEIKIIYFQMCFLQGYEFAYIVSYRIMTIFISILEIKMFYHLTITNGSFKQTLYRKLIKACSFTQVSNM